MARMIGYAEDAMTFKVFKENLDDFLNAMNVKKESRLRQLKNAVVFYRPSFGRKQLGEIDSIVATDTKIYLVECKWHDSGELKKLDSDKELLKISDLIRPEQINRNEVITSIIDEIVRECGTVADPDKLPEIIGMTIEKYRGKIEKMNGSVIGQNMAFIFKTIINTLNFKKLKKVRGKYDVVRNVVLFLIPKSKSDKKLVYQINNQKPLKSEKGNEFNILSIYYSGLENYYRFVEV